MDLRVSMMVSNDRDAAGVRRPRLTGLLLATLGLAASVTASSAQVPYARLVDAPNEPGAWLTYSGSYSGQRYSTLDQIDTGNAQALKPVWMP